MGDYQLISAAEGKVEVRPHVDGTDASWALAVVSGRKNAETVRRCLEHVSGGGGKSAADNRMVRFIRCLSAEGFALAELAQPSDELVRAMREHNGLFAEWCVQYGYATDIGWAPGCGNAYVPLGVAVGDIVDGRLIACVDPAHPLIVSRRCRGQGAHAPLLPTPEVAMARREHWMAVPQDRPWSGAVMAELMGKRTLNARENPPSPRCESVAEFTSLAAALRSIPDNLPTEWAVSAAVGEIAARD